MGKYNSLTIIIIAITFLIGIFSYSYLPAELASHWNAQGEVNGYMTKFWGVFLLPIIMLGIFLLFFFIPKIDPLKENYKKFRRYYDSFVLVIILFMFYTYLITLLWNLGIKINMSLALIPALGFLFIYLGIILKNVKRNWFIGIRTPWTISSDRVWKKTHELGSKLFIISGVITLAGIFFPQYILWFVIIPVLVSVIISTVYSYLEYRKKS